MTSTDALADRTPPEQSAPRDPFARAKPSDAYWVQLKPVFKARMLVHPEKLAQIAVTGASRPAGIAAPAGAL